MIAHVGEKPLGLSYLDLVSVISNECSQGFHFKLSCVKQICSSSSNEVVSSVERAVLDTAFARDSFAALWLSVVSDYQRSSKQMIYTRKIGGGEDCAVAFTARLFQHSAGSTFPMFRAHIQTLYTGEVVPETVEPFCLRLARTELTRKHMTSYGKGMKKVGSSLKDGTGLFLRRTIRR